MPTSIAAQAVAAGPPTLAPPSFEGNNALYVLNLFVFLAGTEMCWLLTVKLIIDHFFCAIAPWSVAEGEAWWARHHIAARIRLAKPERAWLAPIVKHLERVLIGTVALIARLVGPDEKPGADGWRSPIMLWRRIGILWSFAFGLRCFSEMQSLWRWYPLDPVGTGRGLALKRILDPTAAFIGYLALALFFLALPGITEQLRKQPFPINMWTALPRLKRPGGVLLCCLGAAIAVVVFR